MNLSERHLKMLRDDSAIADEVINARGYRTITDKQDLEKLGFSKSQQLTPGLLMPVKGTDGTNGLNQFRPDRPRTTENKKTGKVTTIKYETPFDAAMRLDCPPVCREQLADPSVPLWLTEGIKKGDALASAGFCAVAMLGVWNFKGKNDFNGVTFLADFDYIALNERTVCIVFDSDVMQKPEVRKAMERLTEHLERKGAVVKAVYLPDEGNGKTGVDDYLAKHSRAELEQLVSEPKPEAHAKGPVFELLDNAPEVLRRPLQIVAGRAYAATWVNVKRIEAETLDDNGNIVKHNPPKETVTCELYVVCEDSELYGMGYRSIKDLDFEVALPGIPPEKLLQAKTIKAIQKKQTPNALQIFERIKDAYDSFLDFNRSLADQETMCELSACYVFATWFLDAFNVTGYIYPTGGKGSGKTKHLSLTCELSYLGQLIQAGGTLATLRDLSDCGAFLGFDDAEQIGNKNFDPDKRNLMLSGNRRGPKLPFKEPVPNSREWRTRYVDTYCPKGFSAIKLPDDVLGDRTITLPLIRTANKQKADADVADIICWKIHPEELRQNLWHIALTNLTKLKEFDRQAAAQAALHGRTLDAWRGSLAVALWLDEQDKSGVLKRANKAGKLESLFERLSKLSVNYQTQRNDLEKVDFTRIVLRAVVRCILGHSQEPFELSAIAGIGNQWKLLTADVTDRTTKIIDDEEIEVDFQSKDEKDFFDKLTKRVGRELKKLRFTKDRQGGTGKSCWFIRFNDLETLLPSFNLAKSEDISPQADTHPKNFTNFTNLTSSQNEQENCEHCEVSEVSELNKVSTELFNTSQKPSKADEFEKSNPEKPLPKTYECPNADCRTLIPFDEETCPSCQKKAYNF